MNEPCTSLLLKSGPHQKKKSFSHFFIVGFTSFVFFKGLHKICTFGAFVSFFILSFFVDLKGYKNEFKNLVSELEKDCDSFSIVASSFACEYRHITKSCKAF